MSTEQEDDFTAAVVDDEYMARREAVEAIKPFYDWKVTEKSITDQIKNMDPSSSDYGKMGTLRRWLHDHPGEQLYDLEAGLVAYLQPRSGPKVFSSTLEIRAKAPDLFEKLTLLGCLQIDAKRVADCLSRGELTAFDLGPWSHETEGTPALKVEFKES